MHRGYNIMFGRAYDYVQWVLRHYCALRNLIAALEAQFISFVLVKCTNIEKNVFTAGDASILSIKLISVR